MFNKPMLDNVAYMANSLVDGCTYKKKSISNPDPSLNCPGQDAMLEVLANNFT